jgi:MFS transporter, SP family, galactose:H+ symporter
VSFPARFCSLGFALSTEMQGVVTSAVLAGACLAAGFGGWLADRFGRRLVMLNIAVLFIIGALVSAFAGSVDALLAGRFLIGICIGIVSFVAPLYIAEIAPPRHRGKLVSLNQLAITIGILVSYIVDTAFAVEGSWRWMLGLGALPGILLAVGMAYLPESPRWLLKSGRETEAANVLKRVRGSADVIAEIADIKADLKLERDTIGWRQLLGPTFRRPMLLGVGLAIFQQITGINTVIYYAPTIFQSAGFKSATAAILATAGVGVINVAFTIVALRIVDGPGRRA